MNSEERKKIRYENRQKERRKNNIDDKDMKDIFDYDNIFNSYLSSTTGDARNKRATARFKSDAPLKMYKIYEKVSKGNLLKSQGLYTIKISKKGRTHDIYVPHLEERISQKCFADNCLKELISPSLVYENVGNIKNKGTTLAREITIQNLREIYRHYGTDAFILIMDYTHYFDSIESDKAIELVSNYTKNILIRKQTEIYCGNLDKGVPYGGPVPQYIAVAYSNFIDHYIKEVLHAKQFCRCVDDSYIMHQPKEYLEDCLEKISEQAAKLGLTINKKKTKILPINNFKFLKLRYTMNSNGKITTSISGKKMKSIISKFEKINEKLHLGRISIDEVNQICESAIAYVHSNGSHLQEKKIIDMSKYLFGGYNK